MFSSISPPQPSPCFTPQTFSFGFNNYHDLFLRHDNLTTTTTSTTPPLIPPTVTNQEIHLPNDQYGLNNVPRSKKQTIKRRERHCKIVTAQGLRDRRVRLSIGIAREFFDLQDLLGFDKASKTLEWLLSKSQTAIYDLVQMKQNVTAADEQSHLTNNSSTTVQVFENSARELRAKARARARERTLEKYCTMKLSTTNTFCTSVQVFEKSARELRAKASKSKGKGKNTGKYCTMKLSTTPDDEMKKMHNNSKPSRSSQLGSCSICESELFCFCQLNA